MSTHNTTIEEQAARYITVDILPPAEDIKRLADGDRRALKLIIEASQIMDSLFLRQVSHFCLSDARCFGWLEASGRF
jgi:hypothetical protein